MNIPLRPKWKEIILGDYIDVSRGASPRPKGDPRYFGGDIPWISIRDVNAEKGKFLTKTTEGVTKSGAEKSRLIQPGALILSNSASVCIPKILKVAGCIHDGFVTFPNIEKHFCADYFYYYFDWLRPAVLNKHKQGVTQVNLNTEIIRSFTVPIPPFPEQIRIAQKLDELLAQVDTLKTRIDAIPALLKRFRQSVLTAAVSGRLTEEWRGVCSNWRSTTIGGICIVSTGKTPKRDILNYWEHGDIPWLTSAVTGAKFCSEAEQFVTKFALKDCSLKVFQAGTLLMAMYGEGKTRGQVTELKIAATCNQACAAMTVDESIAKKEFVKIRLQENYEAIRKQAVGGAQPNLNLNKVREISISLPSLEEQTEIVRRVEQLFAFADQLESKVASAKSRIDHLTQSILAKAFRGELVPQDPNDEPASVLLERIKVQRAAAPKAKRAQKSARV